MSKKLELNRKLLLDHFPSIHPTFIVLVGAGSHAHMHKTGPGDRGGAAQGDGGGGGEDQNKNKNKSGFVRRGVRNWEDGEKLKVCGEGASMHASGQHNLPSSCFPPTSLILLTCTFPQVGHRKHTHILRSRSRSRSREAY
jgi:hypothetical protein